MNNKVSLITYIDRMSGGDINDLYHLLNDHLPDVFGGIHLLPFYYPIDGSDAGFDPIDHTLVDHRLGTWQDIKQLGEKFELTADLIVNHISAKSHMFEDYLINGDKSAYKDLFMTMNTIFPDGATEEDLLGIYRPRPGLPFSTISRHDGRKQLFWTTFTPNQIDINVQSPTGISYLESILQKFSENGIKLIRLDAAGYAIKKRGTSCFMIPETYDFIKKLTDRAHQMGMEVLVEIHSYYKDQIEIAKKVDYVYDFALPPLILHALYSHTGEYLHYWLSISPKNAITVLDTHDGIGVIDVGPKNLDKRMKGLLPDEEIERLVEEMHSRTNGTSRKSTGAAASNLDLYQVNSTYYDALGQDDDLYILARLIQFFTPGLPQVYYMGLFCESNDMHLLEQSKVGRDINRHYFEKDEVLKALDRKAVRRLINLIRYRNNKDAFNGAFTVDYKAPVLRMTWSKEGASEEAIIDFHSLKYKIISSSASGDKSEYIP